MAVHHVKEYCLGVITTATEGVITFLNPAAEVLTGWREREAVGMPLKTVVHLLDEKTRPLCECKHIGSSMFANYTVLVAKDGTERIVEMSNAPICDGNHVLGAVVTFRDITEKQKGSGLGWLLLTLL